MKKEEIAELAKNGRRHNNQFEKKYRDKMAKTARSKALGLNKKSHATE